MVFGFRISENPVGWGEEEGAHGMRVGITEVFSYDDSWGIGFFWVARCLARRYLLGGYCRHVFSSTVSCSSLLDSLMNRI
jgi:hypothetical protein